jgi:hypothetical protein
MKRKLFWALWAVVPVGILALHLGPGQRWLTRDRAADHLRLALVADEHEDYAAAAEHYGTARAALPPEQRAERVKLALREARANVYAGNLIEGSDALETLIAEEEAQPKPDAAMVREARHALGEAGYFTAWLMRLGGAAAEEWKPETERSRQQYRLLAESATSDDAETFKKNVEQVIRLEQMDLSELKALPLPKKCNGNCNCNSLCQKKREQRLSKCKNPGQKDVREKIKTDAAGAAKDRDKGS